MPSPPWMSPSGPTAKVKKKLSLPCPAPNTHLNHLRTRSPVKVEKQTLLRSTALSATFY